VPFTRYNPWRDARDNWPEVQIVHEPLPAGVLGIIRCDGLVVVINERIARRQARCVLAHEIVHMERGLTDCLGMWRSREELAVHDAAARRLITLDQYAAAVVSCGGSDDVALAAELDVDQATLQVRAEMLTTKERLTIQKFYDDREIWLAG
jgi:hypothetical protein